MYKETPMDKLSLKKELKSLGINIVKGNYVKRSDVQNILSDKKVTAILSYGKPVKVDCTLAEIETKDAFKTYAPDTYYIDYEKLPECIKKLFEKAKPIVENSRYTVFKPIAYLLASVVTKDGAEVHLEVHLGEIEEEEGYEEGDEDYDIDAYQQNIADEMKATFDWRMQDVYFEIVEYPKEEAKAKAEAEAKVKAEVKNNSKTELMERVNKMNKTELKRQLKKLGISVVGNHIKKSDIAKIVAKADEYIIKDKDLFWTGTNWHKEYPEAKIFKTEKDAVKEKETKAKKGSVIQDYGYENEKVVD